LKLVLLHVPGCQTCEDACREVERAIHSGQLRIYLYQGHFPDSVIPPLSLPVKATGWFRRIRIEWSSEDARAELWVEELLEQYRMAFPLAARQLWSAESLSKGLRPAVPSYPDFWSCLGHREDANRLWQLWSDNPVNQIASNPPRRRKPGRKPVY